jgi:hypothetical protein
VNENKFLRHIRSHHNVRYECTHCQLQFVERILLVEHQKCTGHFGEGIVESLGEIIDVKPEIDIKPEAVLMDEELDGKEENKDKSSMDVSTILSRCLIIISILAIFQQGQKTSFLRNHFGDRINNLHNISIIIKQTFCQNLRV